MWTGDCLMYLFNMMFMFPGDSNFPFSANISCAWLCLIHPPSSPRCVTQYSDSNLRCKAANIVLDSVWPLPLPSHAATGRPVSGSGVSWLCQCQWVVGGELTLVTLTHSHTLLLLIAAGENICEGDTRELSEHYPDNRVILLLPVNPSS